MPESIDPADLVAMNQYITAYPVSIYLIYANAEDPDNHFGQLYHPEAKTLWLHKELAPIVLRAGEMLYESHDWSLQILDGLRPVEAQARMQSFGFPEDLVAPPGVGGHPRGMAVDVRPLDKDGALVPMGTNFDSFSPLSARDADHPSDILENRSALTEAMMRAAQEKGRDILPLPSEWWDFRFPKEVTNTFKPLTESDLYPYQRLLSPDIKAVKDKI